MKSRTGTATALIQHLRINRRFGIQFVSIVVAAHGLFIIASTLLEQIAIRHSLRVNPFVVYIPLLVGISLLYLSTQLRRQKRTAWLVTVLAYTFYLGIGVARLTLRTGLDDLTLLLLVRVAILPAAILVLLVLTRSEFVVGSDIQGFRGAARFSLIMLLVAVLYGLAGFSLLDKTDFHQEIGPLTALHYTVDQFDLTTNQPLVAYTKRAQVFMNSLTFVSLAAVSYAALSLFQPLRMRLSDQTQHRQELHALLAKYPSPSEDYFKLWPHDKLYFFDDRKRSGLAFHVYHGVALCLGDPAGDPRRFGALLNGFQNLCFGNDWLPAMIHIQDTHRKLYARHGYSLQKIGQEAVVDIAHFQANVAGNKYFRHIRNKFTKQGFSTELLLPPHHDALLQRLQTISNEWLSAGGRVERGFAMGYFTPEYIQQCPVMVVRDAAGTIQAFLNQLPADFDPHEATFDMLRHSRGSLGNINDFLMMNFIAEAGQHGYQQLNLGLCPLVGLNEPDDDRRGVIDGVLRFAYANGDRFYSFSGLYRFKAKYEPQWRDRYIAYQSGIRGFTRTTNALMRTMRVKRSAHV